MKNINLLKFLKPTRYISGEINASKKNISKANLKVALCFPDLYEIGASNLGLTILYRVANAVDGVCCERVFAPWIDVDAYLKTNKIPLSSFESGVPLNQFDIVGFSLQYDLSYSNVLNMLLLAQIPLLREERNEDHPLVIAGGPCCFNPEVMAPFVDLFVVGEGEEVFQKLLLLYLIKKQKKLSKIEFLNEAYKIDGVYVPALYEKGETKIIEKATLRDLTSILEYSEPIIPFGKPVHDRLTLEIQRGCVRGCRFCHAGFISRPLRQVDPNILVSKIFEYLSKTGFEEISFLSLNTLDYAPLHELLKYLYPTLKKENVSVSLPSLRVEKMSPELIQEVLTVRQSGFTFAPEAASSRLLNVINKNIQLNDLIDSIKYLSTHGIRVLKLYFMLGLPTETLDDVKDIGVFINEILRQTKVDLNVTLSPFIPKPHTPFQWERQLSFEEINRRIDLVAQTSRSRRVAFKIHDPKMSEIEGLLSRGGREASNILHKAVKEGAKFDSWGDVFNYDIWHRAISETAGDTKTYLGEKPVSEKLPWDYISCGVSERFLKEERELAVKNTIRNDCLTDNCCSCGVCDAKNKLENKIAINLTQTPRASIATYLPEETKTKKLRFRYSKVYPASLFSQLELQSIFIRAFRRANVPMVYSRGFNPRPKISFGPALSIGVESDCEYLDMQVFSGPNLQKMKEAINATLPESIVTLEIKELSDDCPSLSEALLSMKFEIKNLKEEPLNIEIEKKDNNFRGINKALKETYNLQDEELLNLKIKKISSLLN